MKAVLIGALGAFAVMFLFLVFQAITGWEIRFFSGWMSCLTYIEISKYVAQKKKYKTTNSNSSDNEQVQELRHQKLSKIFKNKL
jgi:hypothetical protein